MRLLASLVVGFIAVSHVFAGMTITSVNKTEGAGKGGDHSATVRIKADGDGARVEWIEGRSPMGSAKGFMVTKDAGKNLYFVDPEKKEYINASAMAQLTAGVMNSGLMNMKLTEYKVEKTLDEAGPTVLGYPTRHYKFVTSYTMEMVVFGMKQTTTGKSEHEIWATQKVKMNAMSVFEKMGSQMAGGFGDLQKIIEAEKEKWVKGFPLKSIMSNETTSSGKPHTSKTTTEVTEIKEGSVPASEFEIPKDYKETSMGDAAGAAESGGEKAGKPAGKRPPVGIESFLKNLSPQ